MRWICRSLETKKGFSLLEMLVAMAVLILLVTLLSMTLSQTSLAVFNTRDRSEIEARAGLVFSIFGRDFNQSILSVRDISPAEKKPGNDTVSFYTKRRGYTGDRPLSAVTYEVLDGELRRGAVGQKFGVSSDVAGREILRIDPLAPIPKPVTEDNQVVASGVVRMEVGYIDSSSSEASFVVNWPGTAKVTSVLVTLVMVEGEGRVSLDSTQLAALEEFFPDASDGEPPLAGWQALAQNTDGSLPTAIHRSLRVYQRLFAL